MSERQFIERRVENHHARLAVHWTGCRDCGARELRRASALDRELAPEADAVCTGCGALYTCDPTGNPQLLVPGFQVANR